MAENSVLLDFLHRAKVSGAHIKVFIEGSSPTQPKTMLSGTITDYDNEAIVLDECLIFLERVISIAPFH